MAADDTILDLLRGIVGSGLIPLSVAYDYVSVAYPSATQEVYSFRSGGSGGTLTTTITINYTDSTKDNLLDVTKT